MQSCLPCSDSKSEPVPRRESHPEVYSWLFYAWFGPVWICFHVDPVLQLSSQITTIKFENMKADVHKDSMRLPLLKVVFEAIDKDKSGTISYDELASFGQVLNLFEILKFLSFWIFSGPYWTCVFPPH
jgi:hypothetical protein